MANIVTETFASGFRLFGGEKFTNAFQKINNAFNGLAAIGALVSTGGITALSATATTSGGATVAGIKFGTDGLGVYFGTGTPTISAPQGSIYLNKAGNSTSSRLFVNSNGTTGWVAVTTAT
jgi:hypothetical protein